MISRSRIIKMRFYRMKWVILLCSLLATAGAVLAYQRNWFDMTGQEAGAYDSGLAFWTNDESVWQPWAKAPRRSDKVVLIAIDDRTIEQIKRDPSFRNDYGRWPYARSLWAQLLHYLSKDVGARATVLDLLMTEPTADDTGVGEILKDLSMPVFMGFNLDPYGVSLPGPLSNDSQSLEKTSTLPEDPAWPLARRRRAAQVLQTPVRTQGLALTSFPPAEAFDATGNSLGPRPLLPQPPIEPLWGAVRGFGLTQLETTSGPDARMRSTRFAYTDGKNTYVTLSVAVMMGLEQAKEVVIRPGQLQIGTRTWRINQDGSAGIPYEGTIAQQFTIVSLIDVLRDVRGLQQGKNAALRDLFHNKVVMVGGFAAGTADLRSTPFENFTPGVVKHAAEIDAFLQGQWIVEAPFWISVANAFVVALISLLVIVILESEYLEMIWAVVLFALSYFGPGSLMVYTRVHVLSVLPSIAGTLASLAVTLYQQGLGGKSREEFRAQFRHVMNPNLVDWLAELQHLPPTKGTQQYMTVLVFDGSLFEALHHQFDKEPAQLMRWLNRYYEVVTEAVLSHGGCVDQYVRGSVIALFGAPASQPDHVLQACRVGWAVLEKIRHFREELQHEGLPEWHVHMSIHTGSMLVGNIGSHPAQSYSALGPEMDKGLRLGTLRFPSRSTVVVSENVKHLLQSEVILRELAVVPLSYEERVFELIGMVGESTRPLEQGVALYEQGLQAYRMGRFVEAFGLLAQACALVPTDVVMRELRQRCHKQLEREEHHENKEV